LENNGNNGELLIKPPANYTWGKNKTPETFMNQGFLLFLFVVWGALERFKPLCIQFAQLHIKPLYSKHFTGMLEL
jgi:hypothetical protein